MNTFSHRPTTLLGIGAFAMIGGMALAQPAVPQENPDSQETPVSQGNPTEPPPLFNETLPEDLEHLEVVQHLDEQIPLDLPFLDERGRPVRLGDYFGQDKPVLLAMVYYRCPMLCNLVLDGMVRALQDVDLDPGTDFDIVTVSIDPNEKPNLAQAKRQSYIKAYGRPGADIGWHALTGPAESSRGLADALGFPYRYLPERNEFSHPATLFVINPDGRISRYLFGVMHEPKTLRLALVEGSEGKIGSPVDQFLLYCYQYDAEQGRYAPVAMRIMRIGALGVSLLLGALIWTLWRREARQKRLA